MSKIEIRSPIPGTFYRKPSPESAVFKDDGADVVETDVIGLVEVMKTFHEVKSEVAGTITTFQAENEEPIMAGQIIAVVEG